MNCLGANTDPQRACRAEAWRRRDSLFIKGPADMRLPEFSTLNHEPSTDLERKPGLDATKKLPGEGFKRPWPPLIKMDESGRKKIDAPFGNSRSG